ncbi:hypothetical protein AC249_AIPGENE23565, partial [Exaiptasia diaphana]
DVQWTQQNVQWPFKIKIHKIQRRDFRKSPQGQRRI